MMKSKLKKVFIMFIMLALPLFASASNESPTVKSSIAKDGTLNFDVNLSNMNLDDTIEYEWGIVSNKVADVTTWNTVNDWNKSGINIKLVYSNNDVFGVLSKVDTGYIVIREKTSLNIISNHVAVDVSVPYEYGAVPTFNVGGILNGSKTDVEVNLPNLFKIQALEQSNNGLTSVKITDQNIIDKYLALKDTKEDLTAQDIATFITSLNLSSSDVPANFDVTFNYYNDSNKSLKKIGVTDKALYFIWGRESHKDSKTIYGVTLYDNGYDASISNNNFDDLEDKNITSNDDEKTNDNNVKNSGTTKNPETGVHTYTIALGAGASLAVVGYIVLKKKNKINRI